MYFRAFIGATLVVESDGPTQRKAVAMAITNPNKSCREESGSLICSHSEHDAETPHRFDVVTATGRPIEETRPALPTFSALMSEVFG